MGQPKHLINDAKVNQDTYSTIADGGLGGIPEHNRYYSIELSYPSLNSVREIYHQ